MYNAVYIMFTELKNIQIFQSKNFSAVAKFKIFNYNVI